MTLYVHNYYYHLRSRTKRVHIWTKWVTQTPEKMTVPLWIWFWIRLNIFPVLLCLMSFGATVSSWIRICRDLYIGRGCCPTQVNTRQILITVHLIWTVCAHVIQNLCARDTLSTSSSLFFCLVSLIPTIYKRNRCFVIPSIFCQMNKTTIEEVIESFHRVESHLFILQREV